MRWPPTSPSDETTPMTPPPELIATERLLLRRPKPSDAAAVFEYGRDPDVARYMDWPALTQIEEEAAATQRALARWDTSEEYSWRIVVPPRDTPIGTIGCRVDGHAADLGFVLARRAWGNGYGTEAARAVLEWASSLPTVHRVWATCDVENAASARVLDKIGMSREGTLRRFAFRPNLPPQPPRVALVYSWVREA